MRRFKTIEEIHQHLKKHGKLVTSGGNVITLNDVRYHKCFKTLNKAEDAFTLKYFNGFLNFLDNDITKIKSKEQIKRRLVEYYGHIDKRYKEMSIQELDYFDIMLVNMMQHFINNCIGKNNE